MEEKRIELNLTGAEWKAIYQILLLLSNINTNCKYLQKTKVSIASMRYFILNDINSWCKDLEDCELKKIKLDGVVIHTSVTNSLAVEFLTRFHTEFEDTFEKRTAS